MKSYENYYQQFTINNSNLNLFLQLADITASVWSIFSNCNWFFDVFHVENFDMFRSPLQG